MKMWRSPSLHISLGAFVALAALFFVLRHASGATSLSDDALPGHRLAEAWCKECHAIEATSVVTTNAAPDFRAIAAQPSTTALSLKVFLQTSHRSMPNIVIAPSQADDLANYILSLKRN